MPNMGTGDGTVTMHVLRLPGQPTGELGVAGEDKAGSSVRVVTRPWWHYIGVEIAYTYLLTFFGIMGMEGLGLAELAPAGDAFDHLWEISKLAAAPTILALGKELLEFLGKVRQAARPA